MKGAPRKMNRKHGTKVTQVASRPPSIPAVSGRERSGIAERAHEADELQDHDERAGRRLGHAEAVEHLAGLQPAVVLDRLLGDIGQDRVGAAEGHHRHGGEEDRDLAEHVARPSVARSAATGTSHRARQTADTRSDSRHGRAGMRRQFLAEQGVDKSATLACPGPRHGRLRPRKAAAPARPPRNPITPASEHDDRERHSKEEDRHEGRGGERRS